MTQLLITPRGTDTGAPAAEWEPATQPEPVPQRFTPDLHAADPIITGAMLLNEAHAFLRRFVVFSSPAEHVAATLWPAHTHVTDADRVLAVDSTTRLIVAGEKGSGKTLLMKLELLLSARGKRIIAPTGPALARLINQLRCTLFVDETDLLFGNGADAEMVRAILNSGWQRGEVIPRANGDFETFAPAAVAGLATVLLGNPHLDTLRDRSVIIHMAKPEPGSEPKIYRPRRDAPSGERIGAALAEWGSTHAAEIASAWPELPDGLVLRGAEKWETLIAVADVAGGHWPETARAACQEMTMGTSMRASVLPPRMQLLLDLREVWPEGSDEMRLVDLAPLITRRPGACHGWTSVMFVREAPGLLQIDPVRVTAGGSASQGYTLADLRPAWDEMLPPEPQS